MFEDLLEINNEIAECDASEKKSNKSLFVHLKGLRPKIDPNNPRSLESQITMKYDNFWNDGKLKEEMKKMTASELKDRLRTFDDTKLSELVSGKREEEATKGNKEEEKTAEAFYASSRKFRAKFNGNCNHCGITGHREADCYKKKRDSGQYQSGQYQSGQYQSGQQQNNNNDN